MTRQRHKQLMRLMARIAEAAYRRGFQQGYDANEFGAVEVDLVRWRFLPPLDRAPSPIGDRTTTALERLRIEHGDLPGQLDELLNTEHPAAVVRRASRRRRRR